MSTCPSPQVSSWGTQPEQICNLLLTWFFSFLFFSFSLLIFFSRWGGISSIAPQLHITYYPPLRSDCTISSLHLTIVFAQQAWCQLLWQKTKLPIAITCWCELTSAVLHTAMIIMSLLCKQPILRLTPNPKVALHHRDNLPDDPRFPRAFAILITSCSPLATGYSDQMITQMCPPPPPQLLGEHSLFPS